MDDAINAKHKKAGRQGFEPRYYGPEPHVLPLDDLPVSESIDRIGPQT